MSQEPEHKRSRLRRPLFRLQITQLEIYEVVAENVRGFRIERPLAGDVFEGCPLIISGWILHNRDVHCVVNCYNRCGVLVQKCDAHQQSFDIWSYEGKQRDHDSRCRFSFSVSIADLYSRDTLTITAVSLDREHIICEIVLSSIVKPVQLRRSHIEPVILRTIGRAASTSVMQMLHCSQDVVVYDKNAYELFFAQYMAGLFRLETICLDDKNWGTEYNMFHHPSAMGANPFLWGRYSELYGSIMQALLQSRNERVSQITKLYGHIAVLQGKENVRFFVEKVFEANIGRSLDILYGDRKFIYLVRHPCAAYLSRQQFSGRAGDQGDWNYNENLFFFQMEMIAKEYVARRDNNLPCLLIKLEDFARDVQSVAMHVEQFLSINIDRSHPRFGVIAKDSPTFSNNAGGANQNWKELLKTSTIDVIEDRAKLFLRSFGYDIGKN